MARLNDLEQIITRASTPAKTCSVCHLLATLDAEDQGILNQLLADSGIRYSEIAAKLRDKRVADLDRSQYARHARGGCEARATLRPKAKR